MVSATQRRREGAAMVEAVVLLPVMLLLVASLHHVARVHRESAEARGLARRCAQWHALTACPDADVRLPDACREVLPPEPSLLPATDDAARAPRDALRQGLESEADDGLLSSIGVLGVAIEALEGSSSRVSVDREVPWAPILSRPGWLTPPTPQPTPGRQTPVHVVATMPCNPRPFDPTDDIQDALTRFLPDL